MADCSDCPTPPLPGEAQPTTRCDECPYHGMYRVVRMRQDGRRETIYGHPDLSAVQAATRDSGKSHNPHGTLNYTTDTPDAWACTHALADACKPLDRVSDEDVAKISALPLWRVVQAARALLRAEGLR